MGNRYKFALVCMKLQKCAEAEKALILRPANDMLEDMQVVGGAAGYFLLGSISEKQTRQKEAIRYYTKALELDPTLWIAFEKLCRLAPQVKPDVYFREDHPAIVAINNLIGNKDGFKAGTSLSTRAPSETITRPETARKLKL